MQDPEKDGGGDEIEHRSDGLDAKMRKRCTRGAIEILGQDRVINIVLNMDYDIYGGFLAEMTGLVPASPKLAPTMLALIDAMQKSLVEASNMVGQSNAEAPQSTDAATPSPVNA